MIDAPLMSVILITPDSFQVLRRTVRHVAAQSIADRIELVLVASSRAGLEVDESALRGLYGHRIVELGELRSNAHGYAEGIRVASAPVVVLGEDHACPGPEWARALIDAHERGYAVVGPVVHNANPDTGVSWADFLLGYGPWLDPTPAGEVDYLPGHNSAYRRDLLLEYGNELEAWLEAEAVLHWDLRAKGYRLYLEPRAKIFHFNFSKMSSWLAATFHSARTFAARRVGNDRSSPFRRLVYTCATPLIPAIRFRRCIRDLRRLDAPLPWLRLVPALLVSLVVSASGEAIGYALGPGSSPHLVSAYEFHRERHVSRRDRAVMAEAKFWS